VVKGKVYESVLKIDVLPGSTAKDGREMQDEKKPSRWKAEG